MHLSSIKMIIITTPLVNLLRLQLTTNKYIVFSEAGKYRMVLRIETGFSPVTDPSVPGLRKVQLLWGELPRCLPFASHPVQGQGCATCALQTAGQLSWRSVMERPNSPPPSCFFPKEFMSKKVPNSDFYAAAGLLCDLYKVLRPDDIDCYYPWQGWVLLKNWAIRSSELYNWERSCGPHHSASHSVCPPTHHKYCLRDW